MVAAAELRQGGWLTFVPRNWSLMPSMCHRALAASVTHVGHWDSWGGSPAAKVSQCSQLMVMWAQEGQERPCRESPGTGKTELKGKDKGAGKFLQRGAPFCLLGTTPRKSLWGLGDDGNNS